jgi:hypothetical protein
MLDPLIRQLATTHEGEHLATVAALDRVLAASGSIDVPRSGRLRRRRSQATARRIVERAAPGR